MFFYVCGLYVNSFHRSFMHMITITIKIKVLNSLKLVYTI